MIFDLSNVEEKIGYSFKDKMLLRKCFTHSSYANEHKEDDNELLEFFGDAIIKFIDSEFLFKNTAGREGKLTDKRKDIECNKSLLEVVKKLELDKYVLLGKGQSNGKQHDEKLYSSVYEALVAGIYLDGGLMEAKKFIYNTLLKEFSIKERQNKDTLEKDYKSAFQEFVQKNKLGVISYDTIYKKGPEHLPEYKEAVFLDNKIVAEGLGTSKKKAQQESAKNALNKLKNKVKKKS